MGKAFNDKEFFQRTSNICLKKRTLLHVLRYCPAIWIRRRDYGSFDTQ